MLQNFNKRSSSSFVSVFALRFFRLVMMHAVLWRRLHGTGACVPPHFYKWLHWHGAGDTVSRRTANMNLTTLSIHCESAHQNVSYILGGPKN